MSITRRAFAVAISLCALALPTLASAAVPGVWVNVTPAGIDLSAATNDNYGVDDLAVDPARPSDLYAFPCHQGIWKSVDYGLTWSKITAVAPYPDGKMSAALFKTGGGALGMYVTNMNGSRGYGLWLSTDGGVHWVHRNNIPASGTNTNGDLGWVSVDPYDPNHVIVGYHYAVGVAESTDAGATWTLHKPPADSGSAFPFFLDTGNASTTRKNWLFISSESGVWVTRDQGQTWTKTSNTQKAHGTSQIFQYGGALYVAGLYGSQGHGVYRSTDLGSTWTRVGPDQTAGNVFGTPNNVYATYGWANAGGGVDPSFRMAPQPGTSWTAQPTPAGMTNGPARAAVTFDGSNYVIVSGNWNAGIWRYVEPAGLPTLSTSNLLWHHQGTGSLYLWTMNGATQAGGTPLSPGGVSNTQWQVRGTADFGGDGKNDILWQHQGTGELYAWTMNGASQTAGAYLSPAQVSNTQWQVRGLADFSGDGKADILWQQQGTGDLYLWTMNGTTRTGGASLSPARVADTQWRVVGVGDFNGDAKADLLWHHQGTGDVYVWFMNGLVQAGGASLGRVSSLQWQVRQVGDFNADGKPDILWHHQTAGTLYAWYLNGTARAGESYLSPSAVTDTSWKVAQR